MITTLAPSGVPYRMSVATASARLRVRLIRTISRALPRIVAAIAHAQPTLPAPTIPIFMDVSISGYQLVRWRHHSTNSCCTHTGAATFTYEYDHTIARMRQVVGLTRTDCP